MKRWPKITPACCGFLRMLVFYTADEGFRATLVSATHMCAPCSTIAQRNIFAGSQDADEAYFELPLEERRQREAPFVDRTSYTNWTCGLAGALCWVALALDDETLLDEAHATLDPVHDVSMNDGVLFHVLSDDDRVSVPGLLTDHAAYLRALLEAYELSGEAAFLASVRSRLAATLRDRFAVARAAVSTIGSRRAPHSDALRCATARSPTTGSSPKRYCDYTRSPAMRRIAKRRTHAFGLCERAGAAGSSARRTRVRCSAISRRKWWCGSPAPSTVRRIPARRSAFAVAVRRRTHASREPKHNPCTSATQRLRWCARARPARRR